MYSVELILTFFNVFTDFMEKTMPAITPSSESDDCIPQWLLASWVVLAILLIVTLIAIFVPLIRRCRKRSKLHCFC